MNGPQNFKFIGFVYATRVWLNFIHFSGYKYKIRLVSILRKREDPAFISISTKYKIPDVKRKIKYEVNDFGPLLLK